MNRIRTIFILIGYLFCRNKKVIKQEIYENMKRRAGSIVDNKFVFSSLNYLMACYPEFRKVFFYRMSQTNLIISKILEIIYRPQKS